ncbi:somatoliberin [Meriones unguiculatus]|uniref:somatoliberin n=1 Tax=Meriones unguiculatus TaxID=10047 RepID=UPI00293E70E6|nr:somatoliberin [Meriones unguiculatus]XP_060237305.1 somatoliberin [Meriones unguiculatus]XP_060237306.1 somatoliberin [Meriones unguiculatus]
MPLWMFLVILTLTSVSQCSLTPSLPFRVRRHIDAIFTNNYRRVLTQMYVRKMLQDIMNQQQSQREKNEKQGSRLSRDADSTWEDKRITLDGILVALRQKHGDS